MNWNFEISKNEAVYVGEMLGIIMENEKKELSTRENMISFWLQRFPNTPRADAEKGVDKIIYGVSTFNQNYQEAKEEDDTWLIRKIDEATKALTNEQKYECMLNLLLALKAVDVDVLTERASLKEFNFEKRFEELKDSTMSVMIDKVSEEELQELLELIKGAISNSGISIAGNCEIAELIKELPENEEAVKAFAEKNWDDIDYKNYAAIATYISYLEGAMPSIPENTDPEIIAVGVAAGIERDKVIDEANSGKITWEAAWKALKIIGGIILYSLLLWFSFNMLTTFIYLGGEIFTSLISNSLIGFLTGTIIGGYLGFRVTNDFVEVGSNAVDIVGEHYDKAVELITEGYDKTSNYFIETIKPTFNDYLKEVVEFMDKKILQGLLKIKVTRIEPETKINLN